MGIDKLACALGKIVAHPSVSAKLASIVTPIVTAALPVIVPVLVVAAVIDGIEED